MELNRAVLAKRLREFIVSQVDIEFDNIFHLVDSSTILGYLHKQDSKLKPFEGIRVSEIQMSGEFLQGRLKNWSWVETKNNPADWATRPRSVSELASDGFWQRGPAFLRQDFSLWPIKSDFKTERLEGEIMPKSVHLAFMVSPEISSVFSRLLENTSQVKKLYRIVAHIFKWKSLVDRSVSRVASGVITAEEVKLARSFWLRFVQSEIEEELNRSVSQSEGERVHGRFKRLSVFKDKKDIWRVGFRLRE